jgi:hypothetical protein
LTFFDPLYSRNKVSCANTRPTLANCWCLLRAPVKNYYQNKHKNKCGETCNNNHYLLRQPYSNITKIDRQKRTKDCKRSHKNFYDNILLQSSINSSLIFSMYIHCRVQREHRDKTLGFLKDSFNTFCEFFISITFFTPNQYKFTLSIPQLRTLIVFDFFSTPTTFLHFS